MIIALPEGVQKTRVFWTGELDTFVYASLRQLGAGGYDAIVIYSTSESILTRYEKAFMPGQLLQTWSKSPDKTGRWTKGSPVKIPARDHGEVRFIKITPELLRPMKQIAPVATSDDDYDLSLDDLSLWDISPGTGFNATADNWAEGV